MKDIEHHDVRERAVRIRELEGVDALVHPLRLLDVGQRDPVASELMKLPDPGSKLDAPPSDGRQPVDDRPVPIRVDASQQRPLAPRPLLFFECLLEIHQRRNLVHSTRA